MLDRGWLVSQIQNETSVEVQDVKILCTTVNTVNYYVLTVKGGEIKELYLLDLLVVGRALQVVGSVGGSGSGGVS